MCVGNDSHEADADELGDETTDDNHADYEYDEAAGADNTQIVDVYIGVHVDNDYDPEDDEYDFGR